MLRGNVRDSVKRLEDMKQATILRYLNNINLEKEYYLYDEMIARFASGELEDYFESPTFSNLAENDKKDVCNLAKEYMSLCFYAGESEYWVDSIEGVPIVDYELISLKIFDNYDFLLELARDGGEKALDQISAFQEKTGYYESSVIDTLRNSFRDDQLLKNVLIEMSREDSLYDAFTETQKAELCRFPEGTLFIYEDGEVNLRNPLDLALTLVKAYEGEDIEINRFSSDLFSEIKNMLSEIPVELVISNISDDYVREYGSYMKDEDNNQKSKSMR